MDNLSVQNAEENTTAVMGPKALQAKAVHMVRGLISLCSTFESLPEERTISMFLFYHDNVTPRDYEPECFSSVPDGASYVVSLSLSLYRTHTQTQHSNTTTGTSQEKNFWTMRSHFTSER